MPTLSQNFSHTLETNTINKNIKAYNCQDTLVNYGRLSLEASQYFFDDLKSMLESITTLDITFSENTVFEAEAIAPSFKLWGLDFSPCVNHYCYHSESHIQHPIIIRHYEYDPWGYSLKRMTIYDYNYNLDRDVAISTRINNAELTELNYTIEIIYNTDFLIIEYRPYYHKSKKFTICCLIKGEDINGKTVVYESGGCNTFYSTDGLEASGWGTYHKLVWSESPKFNPYTNVLGTFPTYYCTSPCDHSSLAASSIFMDLNAYHSYHIHDTGIKYLDESPYNMNLFKPICCWGLVNFSDNILTGPIDLTVDTNYQINGETYYCSGDYVTTASMQAGNNYSRYAMKFLLKI